MSNAGFNLPEFSDDTMGVRLAAQETDAGLGFGIRVSSEEGVKAGLQFLMDIGASGGASFLANVCYAMKQENVPGFEVVGAPEHTFDDIVNLEMDGKVRTFTVAEGLEVEFFAQGACGECAVLSNAIAEKIFDVILPNYLEYLQDYGYGDSVEALIQGLQTVTENMPEDLVPGEIISGGEHGIGIALSGPEDVPSAEELAAALGIPVEEANVLRESLIEGVTAAMAEDGITEGEAAPAEDNSKNSDLDWD